MTRIKKYKYCIFFDSSALYGHPIQTSLMKLVETYASDDRLSLHVFIPDVVNRELEARITLKAQESHEKASEHIGKLSRLIPELEINIPEINPEIVIDSKNTILKSVGAEIVETPYAKINWNDMVHRATNYLPPFEKQREKGFKDALIAETALEHFRDSRRGITYIFIGNDGRMNQYLREKIGSSTRFIIFESIPEFENYLQLKMDETTAKIANDLLSSVTKEFFNPEDSDSLYIREHLKEKIRHSVVQGLNEELPIESKQMGNLEIRRINIANPILDERLSKYNFKWNTSLIIQGDIDVVDNRRLKIDAEVRVGWKSVFTKKGEVIRKKTELVDITTVAVDYKVMSGPEVSADRAGAGDENSERSYTGTGQITRPVPQDLINQINEQYRNQLQHITRSTTPLLAKLAKESVQAQSEAIKQINNTNLNSSELRKKILEYYKTIGKDSGRL